MRSRLVQAIALAALLAAVAAGCGADEEARHVVEGEPIHLDELQYNVVISRFLNPDDAEDSAYLEDRPEAKPEQLYLGVFMQVTNEGDEAASVADHFTVVDTTGKEYSPIPSRSLFALPLGTTVPPEGELPVPDSAAATGPIQGSMVLFRITNASTENRPLELEIPSTSGDDGIVELDI